MRMQWIAVAALAVSPAWMLAADGTFDKTLHVSGTPTLSVNTGSGYVHVSPGSDNEIHMPTAGAAWISDHPKIA
jgi:hypothetical protein